MQQPELALLPTVLVTVTVLLVSMFFWKSIVSLGPKVLPRARGLLSFSTTSKAEVPEKKVKVYTKTGDKGTTLLFNMQRKGKNEDYFSALGDTDELNAHIGYARELAQSQSCNGLGEQLVEIQSRLMDIGSHIATPLQSSSTNKKNLTAFNEQHVEDLERWIDEMETVLPALKNFILPSGGPDGLAAYLHICRTVCRRAERSVVPIVNREDADAVVQRYLNRLSDYFFVASRYIPQIMNLEEPIVYRKVRPRRAKAEEEEGTEEAK